MTALPPQDLLHQAEAALVDGRPEDTLALCRQLLSEDPRHLGARFLEAEALRDLRDDDEAEASYKLVLSVHPDHSEAWSGMGAVQFDQGRFDEADRCFGRAIRLRDDNADAYYGRAMLRERRGDLRGARRDYLRAWRLSDRYPLPERLTPEDAAALLQDAAGAADEGVRAWLSATPIVLLDVPDLDTCDAYEPPASPAELLGHVTLPLAPEGAGRSITTFPPTVLLYRRNLERYASDRLQLLEALRHGIVAHVAAWLREDAVEA